MYAMLRSRFTPCRMVLGERFLVTFPRDVAPLTVVFWSSAASIILYGYLQSVLLGTKYCIALGCCTKHTQSMWALAFPGQASKRRGELRGKLCFCVVCSVTTSAQCTPCTWPKFFVAGSLVEEPHGETRCAPWHFNVLEVLDVSQNLDCSGVVINLESGDTS